MRNMLIGKKRFSITDQYLLYFGLLFIVFFVCCSIGCGTKRGTKVNQEALATIKEGETTKAQVESRLGPPDHRQKYSGQEMYHYSYMEVSGNIFNPVANQKTESVTITFNEKGIVESISSASGR